MIKFIERHKIILVLFIVIFLSLSSGCGKIFNSPEKKNDDQAVGQKKSPPKPLTAMEDITDSIIKEVQNIKDKRLEIVMIKNDDIEEEPQKNDKEKQDKIPTINWDKLQKDVESLQSSWSNYVNNAKGDGASSELISGFEAQLDTVTTLVMNHEEKALLESTNDLYQYYPRFLNLYKHQAPPDIKEIKYHIQDITINGEKGNWFGSQQSIDEIKQSWETAKSRMEKPDQDINNKVQAAIDSFARSVAQRNIHLVKIKGNIFIKILEEIK